MDHHETPIVEETFNATAYWMDFYWDVAEEDPQRIPKPLGRLVKQVMFFT